MSSASKNVTILLTSAAQGDSRAAAELLPLVYAELHRLARSRMARQAPGNTLQATALVHEAYLRLVGSADPGWNGRAHFFGAAATAMRNILVEQARRKAAIKHGGNAARVDGDHFAIATDAPSEDVLALDDALADLEREDPQAARIVMLKSFVGLREEEIAATLQISERTVRRDWRFARAWLQSKMGGSENRSDAG